MIWLAYEVNEDIKKARIIEMIRDYVKVLQHNKYFVQSLQKPVVLCHLWWKEEQCYDFYWNNHDERNSNTVIGYVNKQLTNEDGEYWQFHNILGIHHIPPGHKDQTGSIYNGKMLWKTKEITYKPFDFLDAIDNNLLNRPGYKQFKWYVNIRDIPKDYWMIQFCTAFDVKYDGKHFDRVQKIQQLNYVHDFKLKRSVEVKFHIRSRFVLDITGTLYMDVGRYVDKMHDLNAPDSDASDFNKSDEHDAVKHPIVVQMIGSFDKYLQNKKAL